MLPKHGFVASSHIVGVTPHPTNCRHVRRGQRERSRESVGAAVMVESSEPRATLSPVSQEVGRTDKDARPPLVPKPMAVAALFS